VQAVLSPLCDEFDDPSTGYRNKTDAMADATRARDRVRAARTRARRDVPDDRLDA
jgi:hypothetical protein